MAMNPLYQNQLNKMLTDPSSFAGTPGFQFALNSGLDAVGRSNSRMRGSGNALAALTQYGTGLAQQDYGNQMTRLGQLSGQEQQYGLGQEQNANTATRNANDLLLGQEQNRTANDRATHDYNLGMGQNENAFNANTNNAQRNAWDYSLGKTNAGNAAAANANNAQRNAWDYSLGQGQNANTATGNYLNYQLGQTNAANNAANNQNQFNLGMYGAQTNRGQAQSNAWLGGQQNQREWVPYRGQQFQRYA